MRGKNVALDHILNAPPAAAPGEEPVRGAVESERQSRTHPAMLAVCLKDGDEVLLSYALLRDVWKREGGRKWELVFDDWVVVLTGRNLGDKLRDMLRLHKLSVLREGNLVEDDLVAEDEAFIKSITIQKKEEDA